MDLKQLRLFVAVCESGSLVDAARSVHLTQPALSRQIRLLEDDLGVVLFDRHPRGMVPTPAGVRLRKRAEVLIRDAEQLRAQVVAGEEEPAGDVAIGVPTSLRTLVLTPALREFAERHPAVRIRIMEGTSRGMRDAVATGHSYRVRRRCQSGYRKGDGRLMGRLPTRGRQSASAQDAELDT